MLDTRLCAWASVEPLWGAGGTGRLAQGVLAREDVDESFLKAIPKEYEAIEIIYPVTPFFLEAHPGPAFPTARCRVNNKLSALPKHLSSSSSPTHPTSQKLFPTILLFPRGAHGHMPFCL